MSDKLLTEHHLEFLSLKGGCTGSSESPVVKMPHCCKSHVAAQLYCASDYIASHRISGGGRLLLLLLLLLFCIRKVLN